MQNAITKLALSVCFLRLEVHLIPIFGNLKSIVLIRAAGILLGILVAAAAICVGYIAIYFFAMGEVDDISTAPYAFIAGLAAFLACSSAVIILIKAFKVKKRTFFHLHIG